MRDLDINNDDDLDDFGTSASASADAYTVNPRIFPSLASALSHAVTDYQSPTPPTTPGPVVARLRAHPHVRPIFMSRTTSMSTTQPGGGVPPITPAGLVARIWMVVVDWGVNDPPLTPPVSEEVGHNRVQARARGFGLGYSVYNQLARRPFDFELGRNILLV